MSTESKSRHQIATLESRVLHSLQRVGYNSVRVSHQGEGQIRLSGKIDSDRDRAIVIAIARTVANVTSVVCDAK